MDFCSFCHVSLVLLHNIFVFGDSPEIYTVGLFIFLNFYAPHFTLVKEALIEIGCVVTSLVVGWLVVTSVHWPNGAS